MAARLQSTQLQVLQLAPSHNLNKIADEIADELLATSGSTDVQVGVIWLVMHREEQ